MLNCFKAYDIRGRLPDELNPEIAYRIGRAYVETIDAKTVVVGGDARLSTDSLKQALVDGLTDSGADVFDIGLVGTEEIYFATRHLKVDGGIVITASHNPADYNGMKLVREESKPISGDSGLNDIKSLAEENHFAPIAHKGQVKQANVLDAYVEHLMSYIDGVAVTPMKIVSNVGNGVAGHVIDALETHFAQANIPVEFIKLQHQPDGTFPNGIPNPLLVENRKVTSDAVIEHKADLGIAFDGDFDRCFLFDENGDFIEGYYIVGLLAAAFLKQHPGQKIIHDPRLTWNTIDVVKGLQGVPVQSKTGHAFIKERMRKEDAIYGGEMSAHHYFRDFGYCDSGMIPWLLVVGLISQTRQSLSAMVAQMIAAYPSSGEINQTLSEPDKAIKAAAEQFTEDALEVDYTDGLSVSHSQWRFNLRKSNTEPVVRLNVESRGDNALMAKQTQLLLDFLAQY